MIVPPAVIVHGLADARSAVAPGLPVTLLSAPGAALYGGCLWWQAILRQARAERPRLAVVDILDCADGSGQAMAALRVGLCRLVLWAGAPGWDMVAAIASGQGGFVLAEAPPALDLAEPGAMRQLQVWLQVPTAPRDSAPTVS